MRALIVIPAYNEERVIGHTLQKLYEFCLGQLSHYQWSIVVSDNNSQDATARRVKDFSERHPRVLYVFHPEQGKGGAIRRAWEGFDADIYCFMDADLSSDLSALPALLDAVSKDGFDVAYGSRYARESRVFRSWSRRLVSLAYRIALRILLHTRIHDAPCGFKAISRKVRDRLLPEIKNNAWFFDSELVLVAEKKGYRICEIPVLWRETVVSGRKSRVRIWKLGREYICEILSLRKRVSSK